MGRPLLFIAAIILAAGLLAVAADQASHAAPLVGGLVRRQLESLTLRPQWQRRLVIASLILAVGQLLVTVCRTLLDTRSR